MKNIFLFLSIILTSNQFISAKVELHSMFTDNMVLQQQTEVCIWGKSSVRKDVKVNTSWNNLSYTATVKPDGEWEVRIKTPVAGGPYAITFSDGEEVRLNNVLIGEVWVCSGQSNMEMTIVGGRKVNNYEYELANADYPQIRLFHIDKATSFSPLDDFKKTRGGWKICSPQTVRQFSAVAYFFGRNIHLNQNVPVGLISSSLGGTVAEAWTSGDALRHMPDFRESLKIIQSLDEEKEQASYKKAIEEWSAKVMQSDIGFEKNNVTWAEANFDDKGWNTMLLPGEWEKQGLPKFDGIVWFRKEVNIPSDWSGKDLYLKLGAIDDNDITYFNGIKVGETQGVYTKRIYKIPAELIKAKKAVITVRVDDTGGKGGFLGKPEDLTLSLLANEKEKAFPLIGDWKYKIGLTYSDQYKQPVSIVNNPNNVTVLYNAMINPMIRYTIKGVIWYQGEANCTRGYQYRELFPLLIRDWRKQWGYNFPFYFVQLPNFGKRQDYPEEAVWAELRESQLKSLNVENTGMAITIDVGEAEDVHPRNKQDVGLRLALLARAKTYRENIPYSGPVYKGYRIEGNRIRIFFDHTDGGLKIKDSSELKGFSIAGSDHKFHWAEAVIEGDEVVVASPEVKYPVAVRYAWAADPEFNLYNEAGLPASPFRTDDWMNNK